MDEVEAKKRLISILLLAAQTRTRDLYLFAIDDRLFVTYESEAADPRTVVIEGAGAIYRALQGTMENRRVFTREIDFNNEWCLDLSGAHFEMTSSNLVRIRISQREETLHEPRRAVPPPPPPDDVEEGDQPDAEMTFDEDELAASLEAGSCEEPPPPEAPPAPPPSQKTPEERAREMVGAILLGTKPFPAEAVRTIPANLTEGGRFVPLCYEGNKLWVAASGPTDVRNMVWQEVGIIDVSGHELDDLLRCYRTDPRHKRK